MFNVQRETYNAGIPVFQHDKSLQVLTGGFTLNVVGYPDGAIIGSGTVIMVDESARTAVAVKSAVVTKAIVTADTSIEIAKGHTLIVGDKLNGKTISAIDKTETTHDVVELGAAYGKAEAIGNKIGSGDGNALLYNPVQVKAGNVHPVTAVVGGMVYARRIGFVSASTKTALPNVIFSQTK